eukprot:m.248427 g.248427  ORF g.248427 m.248427 type:complete len:96 (-) comp22613_c1_seq1:966-1253(-)
MLAVAMGDKLFQWLNRPMPETLIAARENMVMSMVFIFFFANNVSNMFLSTGAFEVYLNGELLHSKLETGHLPEWDSLFHNILTRLEHNIDRYAAQ